MNSISEQSGKSATERYEIERQIADAYASLEQMERQFRQGGKVVSLQQWQLFSRFKASVAQQLESARLLSRS